MRDWRQQAASRRLAAGTTFRFSRTFTLDDVQAFGDLTLDYNPVHYEPRWCEAKGFEGRPICHGLLVGSMLCEPGGQVGWLATRMEFKFLSPTYIGDTLPSLMWRSGTPALRSSCSNENEHPSTKATKSLRHSARMSVAVATSLPS